MKTITKRIVLLNLLVLSFVSVHAQTKTVEFDWEKKDFTENKSKFPFDEPFTFKIIKLPENQKTSLKVTITDITKNKKGALILDKKDSIVDNSHVCNFVVDTFLLPNHYFKIDIEATEESKLKSNTRDSLIEAMASDKAFVNKIQQVFFATKYCCLRVEDFNKLYEDYFNDNGLTNFKIDYKSISIQLLQTLGDALNDLHDISIKLRTLDSAALQKTLKEKKDEIHNELTKNKDSTKGKQLEKIEKEIDNALEDVTQFFKPLYIIKDDKKPYLRISPNETLTSYLQKNNFKNLVGVFKEKFGNIDSLLKPSSTSLLTQGEDELNEIGNRLDSFDSNIQKIIATVLNKAYVENTFFISVLGSNVYDNNTEAGIYTSQTFGYGYSPQTDNGLTYFSFSFFARPVNNSVPLSNVKGFWDNLKVRLCANVGLTLEDITTNKHGEISGLGSIFGNKAGLIGLGIRPWAFLKVDANALLYYMKDPNPLINNKKFVASPFFGVSVNLNIVKLLAGQPNSLTTLQNELKSNKNQ